MQYVDDAEVEKFIESENDEKASDIYKRSRRTYSALAESALAENKIEVRIHTDEWRVPLFPLNGLIIQQSKPR